MKNGLELRAQNKGCDLWQTMEWSAKESHWARPCDPNTWWKKSRAIMEGGYYRRRMFLSGWLLIRTPFPGLMREKERSFLKVLIIFLEPNGIFSSHFKPPFFYNDPQSIDALWFGGLSLYNRNYKQASLEHWIKEGKKLENHFTVWTWLSYAGKQSPVQ